MLCQNGEYEDIENAEEVQVMLFQNSYKKLILRYAKTEEEVEHKLHYKKKKEHILCLITTGEEVEIMLY